MVFKGSWQSRTRVFSYPGIAVLLTLGMLLGCQSAQVWGMAVQDESLLITQDTLPLSPEPPAPAIPEDESTPDQDHENPPDGQEPAAPDPESSPADDRAPRFLRPQNACPVHLPSLVDRLLQDLPTYTELVAARSLELRADRPSSFGTVLIASQPDYTPIELEETFYGEVSDSVQQVFFTTLERQYWQSQAFSLQNYHWLFLAEAENGWYLSQMYSSLGSYPAEAQDAPSPPQESSDGIVGQAVTLWLRDCRAGAVFPPEEERGR